MTIAVAILSLALLLPWPAAAGEAVEIEGYGPWTFGMTPEAVRGVEAHGPYSAVEATGGLETPNGEFMGRRANVSFVFGPGGLHLIQVWAYEGRDPAAAGDAFYEAYRHLSERFGRLHADGRPVAEGLSRDQVLGLVPASFRDASEAADLEAMEPGDSIQAGVERLHLHPQATISGAAVFASFAHSRELGLYWVFVYYRTP